MHFYGWEKGLKTGMYYLRTKAATDAIKFTVDKIATEEPSENSFSRALQGKIQEACFQSLDAPVMIIGSENMPAIPLNTILEQTMIPSVEKVKDKLLQLLEY